MEQAVGWDFAGEVVSVGPGVVTIVEGSTFCVSGRGGDIAPAAAQGLFFRDTRILSTWRLTVDGVAMEPLAAATPQGFHGVFIARSAPRPGAAESTIAITRDRLVGSGMREDLAVENCGSTPRDVELVLELDADFADVFEVKESRVAARSQTVLEPARDGLRLRRSTADATPRVRVLAAGWEPDAAGLRCRLALAGHERRRLVIEVWPIVDGLEVAPEFADQVGGTSAGAQRAVVWRRDLPQLATVHPALAAALAASARDLGALRLFDPEDPRLPAVAAGAPWFMALFGRDSLIASYFALLWDQRLALGTLRMLARHQGTRRNAVTEEQPGRILHEVRFGVDAALALGGEGIYYGSVDATPLFVVLLGELARWGLPAAELAALMPHADRALEWLDADGDRDGDGFVEYERQSPRGLTNQGWKDSWDAIAFADGALARPPIALAEVQGYTYAAHLARAGLAERVGDARRAAQHRERADRLRDAFASAFWLPERRHYALALDADKRPVDALASNMGHCLWSGIVAPEHAADVARHLLSPTLNSGWGVRTLSASMARYNPMSYHNGAVWPHDTAIAIAGLRRYGFIAEAQQLATSLIDAANASGGRLPELLCGFARDAFPDPVPYPTSCSPQAWAAAAPVHVLRVLLGFEPDGADGGPAVAPCLPDAMGAIQVDGVTVGRRNVDVRAEGRSGRIARHVTAEADR